MKMTFDAVVVGGGIAGLTSAAYLSKHGISTVLLEKEEQLGGLVNTFWKDGFAFDSGIRAFENSGILLPMLKNLDIEIEFLRNTVSIGFEDDWISLHSRESMNDYLSLLKIKFPDHTMDIDLIGKEINKVMDYLDVIYKIENPLFLDDIKNLEYITQTLLPWLVQYQIKIRKSNQLNQPVQTYLRKFTNNQALIDMIIQHFFRNTPTNFALSYFSLYIDYMYPKGGTGVLIDKLSDFIKEHEGKIVTNALVVDIDNKKKQITTSDGQQFSYKKLIWAADSKSLYRNLKTLSNKNVASKKTMIETSKASESVLTLFLGTNIKRDVIEQTVGPHGFYTPSIAGLSSLPNWEQNCYTAEELLSWVVQYLKHTTYEISCPAIRDPLLAPEGKTGIIISTLMDYDLVDRFLELGMYEKFKEVVSTVISQVLHDTIFPGLIDQTLFSMCSTPLTMERRTGNFHGAITGWEFAQPMPAENRFNKIKKAIKTPMEDIVQCGQWTFSPAGLPVSILSGKLAADEVSKQVKNK